MIAENSTTLSLARGMNLDTCLHCGMCLQACPTYALFGTEMDGPRGRILLMRAAAAGQLSPADLKETFARHMLLCLECRACESACPSGVKYWQLAKTGRATAEATRRPGAVERFARWLGLRQMMPHVSRLKWAARGLWLYQRTGLQRLVRRTGLLPKRLEAMEAILPPIAPPLRARFGDYRAPAPAIGEHRGDVAFFVGCIQEAFLSPVNQATVRVLRRNGYTVHFPAGQTCCGAAQLHVGDEDLARDLARRNVDAFMDGDYLAVISNAGGCGATLKEEYAELLAGDPQYAARARRFAEKVQDISEFLAANGWRTPSGEVRARATYSDSCHLRHVQKVIRQPRDLLAAIPGLELVELAQPERCCGSAGIYNLVQVETANAILDAKMADIRATGADLIVTSNTGCHMQLIAGARRAGLNAKVMHVVEVLDLAYQNEKIR